MARTKLEHWPDGLLLHLLQLDQLTKLNEHLARIHEAMKRGVVLAGDVLELIEKGLPPAPYVPDEEAAEVAWQAQMNRELEHASIVDLVEVRNVPCPPSTLPLGTSVKGAGNVTVVDPDHYA